MKLTLDHIILEKSKRKTVSIQCTEEGKIKIKAPFHLNKKDIEKMIKKHEGWIKKQQEKIKKKQAPKRKLQSGELIDYLGRQYSIITLKDIKKPFFNHPCLFIPEDKTETNKKKIETFLKEKARDIFLDRLDQHTEAMQLSYNSLKLSSAKTRWGSCSSEGNINLNWKLIFAPLNIIDSVVIHELAHIKHLNHSKDFWDLVKQFDPQVKRHNQWLKDNGYKLKL